MLFLPASEIRLAAPANSLSLQNAFLCGWAGATQHKTILPSKTNLSPA
jgi:hypothetical protein